jgi:hypothetical protein
MTKFPTRFFRWSRRAALAVAVLVTAAGSARAQGAPSDADPTAFAFRLGPVLLTPGLQINELGVDTNVFNDEFNAKRDFVFAASPDLNVFFRLRFVRFTMTTAADFRYYAKYKTERSVGQQLRGRVDFLLSRLKPYVSGERANSFARPNKEIDTRAEHLTPTIASGVYYELSPQSNIYVDVTRTGVQYRNGETFSGVALNTALNHVTYQYSGGLTTAVTPLTTLTVSGNYEESTFDFEPIRNTTSRGANAQWQFGTDAVLRGNVVVGYRDFRPVDPEVTPYKGVTANTNVAIPVLDRGSLQLGLTRDVQYSFDQAQSYFVDTAVKSTYTHRVVGPFDLQVVAALERLDYSSRLGLAPKLERLSTYAGGVGYNLKDQSRFGLSYEYERRHSNHEDVRGYVRRRIFTSWTYRF